VGVFETILIIDSYYDLFIEWILIRYRWLYIVYHFPT